MSCSDSTAFKIYQKAYYQKNRARILERNHKHYLQNRVACLQRCKVYYEKTGKFSGRRKEILEHYRNKMKLEFLHAYGGKCACCGETESDFLTLEHTRHDGKDHRERIGSGIAIYADLKKQGWPKDGYTIYCWNCQLATRFGKVCPHERQFSRLMKMASN